MGDSDEPVKMTIEVPRAVAEWLAESAARGKMTTEQKAASLLRDAVWEVAEERLRPRVPQEWIPPVTRMVNALLAQAIDSGVEEMHLVPDETGVRLFYADAGAVREVKAGPSWDRIPKHIQASLFARIEKLGGSRLYSERAAREGRMPLLHNGQSCDVFARYAPDERAVTGESLVLRIVRRPAPAV